MLPSTCTASMAGSKKICFAIYWSKLVHTRMSWNEDKWLIRFVQVCHDPALLCRQMDSHQRGHIWIRWESSLDIFPTSEFQSSFRCDSGSRWQMKWETDEEKPLTMFTLLSLWGGNNTDMRIKGTVTHCPAPFKGFPCTKVQITPGKAAAYFPEIWKPQKGSHAQHRVLSLEKSGLQKYNRAQNISSRKRAKLYSRLFFFKISPNLKFSSKIDPSGPFALSLDRWWEWERGERWQNTSSLSQYRGRVWGGGAWRRSARPIFSLLIWSYGVHI